MGTQVPLYKGKSTCTLETNNSRVITLLTSLNKVFEILLWNRMKDCWEGDQVISHLQGACHSGKSCIHSALILQEAISVGLGTKKRVLVTYLDVSKAFDGVWIDGLFYQLHESSIVGKAWRLLYLIPEKVEYDHVGLKDCLFNNSMPSTEDRISRGHRAFNAVAGIGIRRKGINMASCSILYWSIIVPIVTYGCEIWVMTSGEINEIRKFKRYIGKRCQRFPKRSPNHGAYTPLGWMSLDRLIQIKKLLFLQTILVMEDNDICKKILVERAN